MGQTMCGGSREELDMGVFSTNDLYCKRKKKYNSPYYERQIRKKERRLQRIRNNYIAYKENKRVRSNSN